MQLNLKTKKIRITKISGICGILLPIVVFICMGFALSHSPWFNWTEHAISDLGIQGISAIFFNSGMIIGGILAFIFSLGLIKTLKNKTGAYLLSLSSIALLGIGIFPETIYTIHVIFSTLFFVLLIMALYMLGLTLRINQSERKIGVLASLFAIIAMFSIIFLILWEGIAIPETIICFPAFVWCMIYGAKMTVNKNNLTS